LDKLSKVLEPALRENKPPSKIDSLLDIVDEKVKTSLEASEAELEIYEAKHRLCEKIYTERGENASEDVQEYFEVLATKYPNNPIGGLTMAEFKQGSKGSK
jgi:hypothetical protein